MLPTKLETILTIAAQNKSTVCVFDLDSTLFNVSLRTKKILNEFAEIHKPELKDVDILHTDWGLREPLNRAGYHYEQDTFLHQQLRDFWVDRFFSNDYLHFDAPYPGAVAFVQKLFQTECQIHYLTGRDVHRMGQGTLDVLNKWGFPTTAQNLHLKPNRSLDDHAFKVNWVSENCPYHKDKPIFFFENEPVNINALGKIRPDIHIVYLDTTHSRREEVHVPVLTIPDFLIEPDQSEPQKTS